MLNELFSFSPMNRQGEDHLMLRQVVYLTSSAHVLPSWFIRAGILMIDSTFLPGCKNGFHSKFEGMECNSGLQQLHMTETKGIGLKAIL